MRNEPSVAEVRLTQARRVGLIVAPLLILVSVYFVVGLTIAQFGFNPGYLLGIAFYWVVWCIAFPLWAVGRRGLADMFRGEGGWSASPSVLGWVLLAIPVVFMLVAALPQVWPHLTASIILLSILMGLWNGTLEEVLWRGAYLVAFPQSRWMGLIYAAIGFSLWHLAPYAQTADSTPLEYVVVTVGGLIFGLCWGYVAWRTRTIRWSVYSHILTNIASMVALSFVMQGVVTL
jgi:uncharacterized protein